MDATSTGRPTIPPTAPETLTADELRAIARLTGATLPGILLGYEPSDEPAHDAVAVRSLLARGAVAFNRDGERPLAELTAPAREGLAPLLRADEVLEVDADGPAGSERHVLASARGTPLRLSEAEPDVWVLTYGGDLGDVLAHLVAALADDNEPGGPHPAPFSVTVSAFAHDHAEMLVAAGHGEEVADVLVEDAVDPADAAVLAAALGHRKRETAVRRAARDVDGGFVAAETCWFSAGEHGWWLVHPADPSDSIDTDDDDDLPDPSSTFHRTTRAAIRAALASTLADTATTEV